MPFASTQQWIDTLEKANELQRVSLPVSTDLEITEIADRQMKSTGGGKALLFEKPVNPSLKSENPNFPLLINAFGSPRRMAMALGVNHVDEVAEQLSLLLKARPPQSFQETIALLRQAMDLRHAKPKRVSYGPCKEMIHHRPENGREDSFSLRNLPVQKCWP